MNWTHTKTYWRAFSGLCLVLLLTQCGGSGSSQGGSNGGDEITVVPGENYFALQTAEGRHEMVLDRGQIFLDGPGYSLSGEKKGDKRKYYTAEGDVALEVKYSDEDKLKIRNADGSLRWKIKLYEDKIKVADNEEMENAYEIRLYEGNRIKIKRNDEELAEWRLPPDATNQLSREGTKLEGIAPGLTAGVVLLDALTAQEQMVLMSELFTR